MSPRLALFLVAAVLPALAAADHGADHGDPFLIKKIFNFAILFAGILYLFIKVINPGLRGQQREIADNLNQAQRRAEEAAERARAIDARLAGLDSEIAALRGKAAAEMRAEAERIEKDTAAQFAKLDQATQQEIESSLKFARQQLKAEFAALAGQLARRQIRDRLDDAAQSGLVERFTTRLGALRTEQQ
jgi:F0F1-type ATP synthase membrane subunit b/b'